MDNRKIIVSGYITTAIVAWFMSRSFITWLHTTFYQVRRLPGIKFSVEAIPVVAAVVIFVVLLRHPKVNALLDEVVSELKKVTWPGREDVVKSTWVVLVCIFFVSVLLAGFDLVWGKVIGYLLS